MILSDFWSSFWANFWSTFFAGSIIGTVFTLIAARLSRIKENNLKDLENQISFSTKAILFLEFIKLETEDIILFIKENKDKIDNIPSIRYVRFNTSYWEILKTSGEIPSLLEPTALQNFTNFYAAVNKCNLLYEQFLDAENHGRANIETIIMEEYTKEIQFVLAMINTTEIGLNIDQVIKNKAREVETLKTIKYSRRNRI